jgi:NADH dehydrogenase
VSQVTQHAATLQDGQTIPSATVIWTAGVEASLPATTEQVSQAAKGKLRVQRTLQLPQYPNVYAIGDLAYVQQNGKPLAGVAPEALQQGVAVARNIRRQLRGCKPLPFRYFNKGRLAIIGGYTGVGKIGPLSLTGFLPWLMWLSVHLVYLPGFRNRLFVFFSWIWNYLLGDVAKQPLCDRRFNRSSQLEDNSLSQLSLPRQF